MENKSPHPTWFSAAAAGGWQAPPPAPAFAPRSSLPSAGDILASGEMASESKKEEEKNPNNKTPKKGERNNNNNNNNENNGGACWKGREAGSEWCRAVTHRQLRSRRVPSQANAILQHLSADGLGSFPVPSIPPPLSFSAPPTSPACTAGDARTSPCIPTRVYPSPPAARSGDIEER